MGNSKQHNFVADSLEFFITFFIGFFAYYVFQEITTDNYTCNFYHDTEFSDGVYAGYDNELHCYAGSDVVREVYGLCDRSVSTHDGIDFIKTGCFGKGEFTFNMFTKVPAKLK